MWLIDTSTLELAEFQQCPAKSYAILSHTWGEEELNFQEFRDGGGRSKLGFEKIQLCCAQAKKDDLNFAWVDTVCIDKRSSTELSEAINSMFEWYRQSKVCYVYLTDVYRQDPLYRSEYQTDSTTFEKSKWFSRGWTLQELIAPEWLIFYSAEWVKIGDKTSLAEVLHYTTRIKADVLTGRESFRECSIAQRMSWASQRITTRIEDMAYSLIGLFNINLPLMYGEGPKALIRLQERIIEETDDETIFAWDGVPEQGSGLLATNVLQFYGCNHVQRLSDASGYTRPPYVTTNKGISIELQMLPCEMNVYTVPLLCCEEVNEISSPQKVIFVGRTTKADQYRRVPCQGKGIETVEQWPRLNRAQVRTISIPTDGFGLKLAPIGGLPILHIRSKLALRTMKQDGPGFAARRILHRSWELDDVDYRKERCFKLRLSSTDHLVPDSAAWGFHIQVTQPELEYGVILAIPSRYQSTTHYFGLLHFGFDFDFRPVGVLSSGTHKSLINVGDLSIPRMLVHLIPKIWHSLAGSCQPWHVQRSFWIDEISRNIWAIDGCGNSYAGPIDFQKIFGKSFKPFTETLTTSSLSRKGHFSSGTEWIRLLSASKGCTLVRALAHSRDGLNWEVEVLEHVNHKATWEYTAFCAKCLMCNLGIWGWHWSDIIWLPMYGILLITIFIIRSCEYWILLAGHLILLWFGTSYSLNQSGPANARTSVLALLIAWSSLALPLIFRAMISHMKKWRDFLPD